eukprot:4522275-Amphidinium_carterae.1
MVAATRDVAESSSSKAVSARLSPCWPKMKEHEAYAHLRFVGIGHVRPMSFLSPTTDAMSAPRSMG